MQFFKFHDCLRLVHNAEYFGCFIDIIVDSVYNVQFNWPPLLELASFCFVLVFSFCRFKFSVESLKYTIPVGQTSIWLTVISFLFRIFISSAIRH